MNCKNCLFVTSALVVACAGGALAFAQQGSDKHAPASHQGGQPEMKLPPGWTMDDMQACMVAGTPGEQHAFFGAQNGTWHGKEKMWMGPGTEAINTTCTATIASVFDGRYSRMTFSSEIPDMGPFSGEATMGYDNVTGEYHCTWIDSMSTGVMNGKGTLSADKKVMTWNYSYNCPITKKPTTMRQVDTYKSENEMKMEMWAKDPKSGKEYKMLDIDYTRK